MENRMMGKQTAAYCHGLAAVLCWSTVATAFKLALRRLDPLQLLLYATAASCLALAAILAAQGRLGILFSYTRKQYLQSLALGALNPFLYYVVLFKAYDLLPAQEAQPLNYTWAIVLALLSIPLLGQRIRPREIVAALVAYAGVVVIATRGDVAALSFSNPLGVGLALGSTVLWALYWIANTRDQRDPVAGLLLNFLSGLPLALAACCIWSTPVVAVGPGLLGAAYVGLFEMGITFVLWLKALKLSENTAKVGNLIFISPFLSLAFIHFLLGEAILPSTYAGLGLVMGGLAIQRTGGR